jgi:phosphoglycerate dehydrogenase-like enzyme
MDILFLDNPTLPINYLMKANNLNVVRTGHENPMTVECIYTHTTRFLVNDYPKLNYVLCPMTGVLHLGDTTKFKLYHLDNRQWLYDNVWSTAEHTFSLIIRLMRGLNREVRRKKVGIIGFGRVGQQLYKLLKNWNVDFMWYDTRDYIYDTTVVQNLSDRTKFLEDLFIDCDIITIHLPENSLTKGMINEKYLSLCTKQPIILNTARASILNYLDLTDQFEKGKIAGFGLDIDIDWVKTHQNKAWDSLEALASVYRGAIITPHVAGKSIESRLQTDKYVFNKWLKDLGGFLYDSDTRLL